MTPVVIALGSNVGDSLEHLRRATALLRVSLRQVVASSAYQTAPMYVEDQPPFLNAVVTATTDTGPRALLTYLKNVEQEIGREARERYGPREIDLDLIAYGSLGYKFLGGEKPLQVPHPRVAERRFVLAPLSEIAPELKLVGLGVVRDLLGQTNGQAADVQRIEHAEL